MRLQPTVDLQIDRLNDQPATAPPPPFPHSSQVRGQLRELRCHYGSELYRVLYRRSGNLIVLLHMLRKDTASIPEADIAVAQAPGRTSRGEWMRFGDDRHALRDTMLHRVVRFAIMLKSFWPAR